MSERSHSRIEDRSLALHQAIGELLRQNPNLREKALENIKRWSGGDGEPSDPYLSQWKMRIQSFPIEDLISFLGDESETARTLRQSSPFTGILTEDRRKKIFAQFA